ncbi:MAG: response regulator [Betaproteobacteria bacterium]|nr:MAG: response regulator [Betaproteobacteria bacterium]
MARPQTKTTTKARILIVDDDKSMLQLLKRHLSNAGYKVLTAEDGVAAGRHVLKARPDLIIADVGMPYMDGYELVAALKADSATRDIPIVFLTSKEDVADYAKQLGAVAYLHKPVLADRLLEIVALYVTPR